MALGSNLAYWAGADGQPAPMPGLSWPAAGRRQRPAIFLRSGLRVEGLSQAGPHAQPARTPPARHSYVRRADPCGRGRRSSAGPWPLRGSSARSAARSSGRACAVARMPCTAQTSAVRRRIACARMTRTRNEPTSSLRIHAIGTQFRQLSPFRAQHLGPILIGIAYQGVASSRRLTRSAGVRATCVYARG